MRALIISALCLSACAHVRPDAYTPADCVQLRHEARRAGSYRVGASAVALGLGAGGAVAPLVSDSKGATVALALGAVLAGAVGLAAGFTADDAQKEWTEECPGVLVEQPAGLAGAPSGQ